MKRELRNLDDTLPLPLYGIGFILLIIFSNLYLQWCQNNLSVDLAFKFAFRGIRKSFS